MWNTVGFAERSAEARLFEAVSLDGLVRIATIFVPHQFWITHFRGSILVHFLIVYAAWFIFKKHFYWSQTWEHKVYVKNASWNISETETMLMKLPIFMICLNSALFWGKRYIKEKKSKKMWSGTFYKSCHIVFTELYISKLEFWLFDFQTWKWWV